jgi:hypothetical protein
MDGLDGLAPGCMFLLEPIGMFSKKEKMTSDTRAQLRFWAHHQLARSDINNQGILSHEQFGEIDWPSVYRTLHNLPRLFQIWVAKHVHNISGRMRFLSHQDGRSKLCPSCQRYKETCQHMAQCPDSGRTLAFDQSTTNVAMWLQCINTHPDIQQLLLQYLRGHGSISCLDCANDLNLPLIMQELVTSQDIIRWDNFMMEMVSRWLLEVQSAHLLSCHSSHPALSWISGLFTQLLQVKHSQWIYRCMLVHDWITSTLISAHKDELLKEINHQQELGSEGLAEEDKFLLECNLGKLITTNGEQQEYWLLAIQASQEACRLRASAHRP